MRWASAVRPASRAPNRRDKPRALVLLAGQDEVLAHGQLGEDLQQLEGAADAQAIEAGGPQPGDDPAVDPTSPRVGLSWPRMQLKRVDLPEPLGPISPRISPSRTSNDTPRTASHAAERLGDVAHVEDRAHGPASPSTALLSSACGRRLRVEEALDQADDAGRAERHHHHHQHGVDDEVVALGEAQPFRQQHGDAGADEGADERAGAADHHHQQEQQRWTERERARDR